MKETIKWNLYYSVLFSFHRNGVGRTGGFCASYTALREIDAGCGIPNILDIVEKQRNKRKYMIQEKNQLKIVHDLVNLYAVDLLEQRGVTINGRNPAISQTPNQVGTDCIVVMDVTTGRYVADNQML